MSEGDGPAAVEATGLGPLGEDLLRKAQTATSGRAARPLPAGPRGSLSQTVIALRDRAGLSEHENPGVATLQVLRGSVRLVAGDDAWDLAAGDHVRIPAARHSLLALQDAVVLLTTLPSR